MWLGIGNSLINSDCLSEILLLRKGSNGPCIVFYGKEKNKDGDGYMELDSKHYDTEEQAEAAFMKICSIINE